MIRERQPGSPRPPARIVIVDDHELARAGLRSMLAQERDLTEVGGESAIRRIARAVYDAWGTA